MDLSEPAEPGWSRLERSLDSRISHETRLHELLPVLYDYLSTSWGMDFEAKPSIEVIPPTDPRAKTKQGGLVLGKCLHFKDPVSSVNKSKIFLITAPPLVIEQTLLHELVHAWIWQVMTPTVSTSGPEMLDLDYFTEEALCDAIAYLFVESRLSSSVGPYANERWSPEDNFLSLIAAESPDELHPKEKSNEDLSNILSINRMRHCLMKQLLYNNNHIWSEIQMRKRPWLSVKMDENMKYTIDMMSTPRKAA